MKTLTITLRAELQVPEDWELAEHPSGMQVLRVGDQYVDFDLTPLTTSSEDPDAEWSDRDQDLVEDVLDSISSMDIEFELQATH